MQSDARIIIFFVIATTTITTGNNNKTFNDLNRQNKNLEKSRQKQLMTWLMNGIWLSGQPQEWAQDQRWTKSTIAGLGLKTASRMNGWRKGMSGTLLLQAFYLPYRNTHKGPAKGLKEPQTSKCSKYRRIDRICGERQPRRRADAHTHTQNQPSTLSKLSGHCRKRESCWQLR